jgi:hypothetical protein
MMPRVRTWLECTFGCMRKNVFYSATVCGYSRTWRKSWTANFLKRLNKKSSILAEVRMDGCTPFRNFTRNTASDFMLLLRLIGPSIKKEGNWVIRVMHLGLVDRPFVPLIRIVPSFISRGTPHNAAREASINDGRKLNIRILQAARNELQLLGSFTCPKVGTWDRLFDFPSEGRHAEYFYIRKIRRLRPGLNPRTREPKASMLTSRPPKPL